ncbi:AbrB family transcriptional regulator [Bradyrhizobium sp. CSA207]|uniref:AbrB/MazE/SpoVT family DNA-binding domain-containing protein n=1 Tax=Bradyrhizobium sp. CSA207 TaxID=2698826 RepID=UPI0023AFDFF5|nr:AbrB/MazE/SpoVT family DNA-binding domain-containing protein [Bradyrhizobium sp. CSA207]MDE5442896.1 AbrB family transcriptional regulator [Bradyrhizobium sp. CSA207]
MAKIFRMDEDLAVELPQALVDALGLKEGDELEVVAVRNGVIELARAESLSERDRDRRVD